MEGGGSGPNVLGGEVSGEEGGEFSGEVEGLGEEGGLGRRVLFLWKKVGWVNRSSKG